MKILIAGALDPYANREEKCLCNDIAEYYKQLGHTTDICYLPFKMDYHGLQEQILAYRLITTYPESDMLITVGYPAFALKHPNKHAFLVEFLPEFHSNYNTEYGFMELWYRAQKDQKLQKNLLTTENICLSECKTVFCASDFLAEEISKLGINSERYDYSALLGKDTDGNTTDSDEYVIESCLEPMDRIDIVLKGFQEAKNDIKMAIYVPDAEECYIAAVNARIHRLCLTNRVRIVHGSITEKDLTSSRGAICLRRFAGHIPAFIMHAAAMKISCIVPKDGGSLNEFPQDDYIQVIEPTPAMIASALSISKRRKTETSIKEAISPKMKADLERLVK